MFYGRYIEALELSGDPEGDGKRHETSWSASIPR